MGKVTDEDKDQLNKMGVFRRDPAMESSLMKPNVNLEVEINDVLKANIFSIKFIALITPSSLPPSIQALPQSLFFTFKFYTFQASQTDHVNLMTSKNIEDGRKSAEKIELAKKYYLVAEESLRLFSSSKPAIEQILDHSLSLPFEVNPLSTGEAKEHEKFAKYLKD